MALKKVPAKDFDADNFRLIFLAILAGLLGIMPMLIFGKLKRRCQASVFIRKKDI